MKYKVFFLNFRIKICGLWLKLCFKRKMVTYPLSVKCIHFQIVHMETDNFHMKKKF